LDEQGDHLYQRFGTSLSYDTRNSYQQASHGQKSELEMEYSEGDKSYYKLQAKTSWFFPGFFKGHIWELDGRTGVADSVSGGDVPFYDRYYLGGLYSLRGFKYRNVAPREAFDPTAPAVPTEPIGGDDFWFGSVTYSLPIFEKDGGVGLRFELFYDIGAVGTGAYSFSGNYDDNWGLGLLLNIPHLGPLRLEYGIPITHDSYNSAGGQFQFGVGFDRPF
jgi:outer membrane protein insertion porin family